jgi:ssDNA-binding Zn-finger/Zn-ribbon topoisomerase 1
MADTEPLDFEARAAGRLGISVAQYRNRHDQFDRYCPSCGERLALYNIKRDHWMACEKCRVKMLWGGNTFSWSHETEAVWQRNAVFLETCREMPGEELFGLLAEGIPGSRQ